MVETLTPQKKKKKAELDQSFKNIQSPKDSF